MCMATNPTPPSAATSASDAETSLTRRAPASTAARATSALRVSIDTGMPSAASARTTGMTRRSSSSTGTGSARGRVDSPPTSTQSAPSATTRCPWAMAASWSRYRPPSENESGVTLTTPMIRGRLTCTGAHPTPRVATLGSALRAGARAQSARRPVRARCAASALADDEAHGLLAGGHVGAEQAPHGRGDRRGAGLADPAHGHAQVLGLDHHHDAPGVQGAVDLVGHLDGQALLHLGPAGVGVDQAGKLGQAGDAAVGPGDVGDVRLADERDEVVLAEALHGDVPHHHHLVVA